MIVGFVVNHVCRFFWFSILLCIIWATSCCARESIALALLHFYIFQFAYTTMSYLVQSHPIQQENSENALRMQQHIEEKKKKHTLAICARRIYLVNFLMSTYNYYCQIVGRMSSNGWIYIYSSASPYMWFTHIDIYQSSFLLLLVERAYAYCTQ